MSHPLNRREFIQQTAAAAAVCATGCRTSPGGVSANEKLNIGIIGVANRGGENLKGVEGENIVALCDVNDTYLAAAARRFPQARRYHDFRRLLDQRGIDAVVISTPDHTHAVAAVAALRSGRHVYCEKPLARTVSETRMITEAARKARRVTQIGTQIHAGSNYRRVVELVQRGAIGPVREVHVWVNATYGNRERPKGSLPVPSDLHYDLWLGPVEYRPYHPDYLPFNWRHWWAFGGGALADFGCHYMDLPHWALGLSRPLTIEVVDGPPVHAESTPPWLIVRYAYGERRDASDASLPPVSLTWYHGGRQPPAATLAPELADKWKSGVLFEGERGRLLSDYGRHMLLPESEFAGFERPQPFIPDSVGHHQEWIRACKGIGTTTCPFSYSGPLTEAALLGNVAYRVGCKLEWEGKRMQAPNCPEAEAYLRHHYRKGWEI